MNKKAKKTITNQWFSYAFSFKLVDVTKAYLMTWRQSNINAFKALNNVTESVCRVIQTQ